MEESILSQNQSVDFSFIALLRATFTVKVVMLVRFFPFLVLAIIIQKTLDYRRSKREKKLFLDEFWSGALWKNYIMKKETTPKVLVNNYFVLRWMNGKDPQTVMEN